VQHFNQGKLQADVGTALPIRPRSDVEVETDTTQHFYKGLASAFERNSTPIARLLKLSDCQALPSRIPSASAQSDSDFDIVSGAESELDTDWDIKDDGPITSPNHPSISTRGAETARRRATYASRPSPMPRGSDGDNVLSESDWDKVSTCSGTSFEEIDAETMDDDEF
jgi:hypothetical protein